MPEMHLPPLPRSIKVGVLWMGVAWLVSAQLGFEAPWQVSKQLRDEWVKAHAAATARIEQQDRQITILQEREQQSSRELSAIRGKLDEMSMVLYSLEKRSR